jgi:hypothetical protein
MVAYRPSKPGIGVQFPVCAYILGNITANYNEFLLKSVTSLIERMPEWSKGAVLSTAGESLVGSNPTPFK